MTKLLVANWKMNQNVKEIKEFLAVFNEKYSNKRQAWIAPQAIHLPLGMSLSTKVKWGAQNTATEDAGAFTGEISPKSLKDLGAHFTIIGHSERRTLFAETDQVLNKKTIKAIENGLKVIFCIGETLAERESDKTFDVIRKQLELGLKDVKLSDVILAYEPVWAIGTGLTATPEQAQHVHAVLRAQLQAATAHADRVSILYGGSMNAANAAELLAQPDVDGGLIGGAALKAPDFLSMLKTASC